MAFGKATGVPGTNTPTPVRGVGTTERLSTHRGDDNPDFGDFDRDTLKRESAYRGTVPVRRKRRR